jgi:hypothetical protein
MCSEKKKKYKICNFCFVSGGATLIFEVELLDIKRQDEL